MAEHLPEIRITVDDGVIQAFQKASDELKETRTLLSEERIRAIVREELAKSFTLSSPSNATHPVAQWAHSMEEFAHLATAWNGNTKTESGQ